ncbi:MAG TPA: hypothetical protein VFU05_20310 [Cyclobacteriaceae bacterium]|nr:hypothetical protein [Cyclobacteriaceae bacterium]
MKSLLCLFIATFLSISPCNSQSASTLLGARANGIGYATSTLFDTWGVFNNIAGTSKIKNISVACTYDAHPSLTGANRTAAALIIPIRTGAFSTGAFRFGDNIYNEHILTVGFSNQFGLAALGAQANYIQYWAEGFGSKGVWSINMGGIAELTKQISVGAYIQNINQPEINEEEKLPTKLVAGFGFKPIEKVFIATEIEKDLEYDATWKTGIEYKFNKKFIARTGYNINPSAAFFGLGFNSAHFAIDYALQHSPSLSLSHQASVSFQLGSK